MPSEHFEHFERVYDLGNLVAQVARPALKSRRNCHWISTPQGDVGGEWCGDCGYFKVRNLRRHAKTRKEAYILDGGWRTESDHSPFCQGCGVALDACLTLYGATDEIEALLYYGVRPGSSTDALSLYEVLNTLEWADPDPELVEDACGLAEALLWSAV